MTKNRATTDTQPASPSRTDFDDFVTDFSPEYADQYKTRRPNYPAALIDWMAETAPNNGHAWDAGAGTGQLAVPLADRFEQVTASDSNGDMLANAVPHPSVTYQRWPSEATDLVDNSIDLISSGMAAHWFHPKAFNAEAERVMRPGGLLAAVGFYFFEIDHGVGDLVKDWYEDALTGHEWPQLTLLRQRYQNLDVPFEPVEMPPFVMIESWTFHQMAWFLHSWVVVKRAREAGADVLAELLPQVADRWPGGPDTETPVAWPLFGRASRLMA